MNRVACALRDSGSLIIHAPSDTMAFYAGTPARQRALDAPRVAVPAPLPHPDPPLPLDASDEGCDTPLDTPWRAWSQQHPAIEIDHERDVISDDGAEIYALYRQRGIAAMPRCRRSASGQEAPVGAVQDLVLLFEAKLAFIVDAGLQHATYRNLGLVKDVRAEIVQETD